LKAKEQEKARVTEDFAETLRLVTEEIIKMPKIMTHFLMRKKQEMIPSGVYYHNTNEEKDKRKNQGLNIFMISSMLVRL
jgi:hypothetical protein